MNSKDFLKFGSSSLILGSSLASLVGTASVNAEGTFGSIKNFFLKNKTENEKKTLSLRERKDKYNKESYKRKMKEVPPVSAVSAIFAQLSMGTILSMLVGCFAAIAAEDTYVAKNHINYWDHYKEIKHVANTTFDKVFKWGLIITALTVVGLSVCFYIKQKTDQKNAKKDFTELKKSISEDMLEKQWALEKFQEMLENKNNCKRFLEQLLVLEPSSSESGNNEKNVPHLNQGDLNEKVQAFKDLFTKEPDELKKDSNKKEIYKEIINSLNEWCSGEMERLYDDSIEGRDNEKKYFKEQEDIELVSKIVLLKKIVLGEEFNYSRKIINLTVKDFNETIKDENMKNFRKLLLFDIRDYISEHDANDETIIKILTKLTESDEMRQPINYYYEKIKTLLDEEFKDKQRQNRVLLGLKNFSNNEKVFMMG